MSPARSQSWVRGAGGSGLSSASRSSRPSSSTGWPASFTGRPMSSTGWPSLARSGKPRESIRGRPVGWGHEPVVKVCPQKWKASESPGSISVPTVRAAVSATRAPPTRARKPRREVSRASLSAMLSRCSGIDRLRPATGGGRQDALELCEVVERPLRQDRAALVGGDRERTARYSEIPPERSVGDLVEDAHGDLRILRHVLDCWRQRLAEMAALGAEDRQSEAP